MLTYNKYHNFNYYILEKSNYDSIKKLSTYKLYYVNNLDFTLLLTSSSIFNILNYIKDNNIDECKVFFKDFSLYYIEQLSSLI